MRPMITLALFATLWSTAPPTVLAQAEQQLNVPLSAPDRPARLEVRVVFGSISVSAYEGDAIVIVAREGAESRRSDRNPGETGLRRIPNNSFAVTAEEYDNTVTVAVDRANRNVALEILVPRATSVHAGTVNGGALVIAGVSGEHELANVNGRIEATDIAGSLVANTTNGELRASFTELAPDKAMSFTTLNGKVDVMFPRNLAADLRISAGRGEIMTDFDFELLAQEPTVQRSEDGQRYRVSLERDVRARVGRGGPEYLFKTFNGDIVIRGR